jgi:ribosomal protein S17
MNKILFIICFISLFACNSKKDCIKSEKNSEIEICNHYNLGDIVYIKPDSTKAVIILIEYNPFKERYQYVARYSDKCGILHQTSYRAEFTLTHESFY